MAKKHCCEMMLAQVEYKCDQHPNPYDCSDNVIIYSETHDEYDLIIHNGMGYGTGSLLSIAFCPWCGANIESRRRIKRPLRFGQRTSERYKALSMDEKMLAQKYPLRKELLERQKAMAGSVAAGILAGEIRFADGVRLLVNLNTLNTRVAAEPSDGDFVVINILTSRLDALKVARSDKGRAQVEELYAEFYKEAIHDACRSLVARFHS